MANDMKKEQELFGRAGRKMAAFLVQSLFFLLCRAGYIPPKCTFAAPCPAYVREKIKKWQKY